MAVTSLQTFGHGTFSAKAPSGGCSLRAVSSLTRRYLLLLHDRIRNAGTAVACLRSYAFLIGIPNQAVCSPVIRSIYANGYAVFFVIDYFVWKSAIINVTL